MQMCLFLNCRVAILLFTTTEKQPSNIAIFAFSDQCIDVVLYPNSFEQLVG